MHRLLRPLAFIILLIGLTSASAQAGRPQLYLSWHAPFGYPGACDTLSMASGDTTHVDTLYFSFDPGHHDDTFLALSATLTLRTAEGDTLNPYWRSVKQGEVRIGPRNPRVQFNDSGEWPYPSPWAVAGIGQSAYDCGRTTARLRMVYAVGPPQGAPVDSGRTYTIARALFRHPAAGIPNAMQPMCMEWTVSTFAYSNFEPEEDVSEGSHRWVSLNSLGGKVCLDYLKSVRQAPAVWDPRKKKK
jgi:hypothetical protein